MVSTINGDITTEYTVWCASCSEWHQECNLTKAVAIKVFKNLGWKKVKEIGWTCPECLKKTDVQLNANNKANRLRSSNFKHLSCVFEITEMKKGMFELKEVNLGSTRSSTLYLDFISIEELQDYLLREHDYSNDIPWDYTE